MRTGSDNLETFDAAIQLAASYKLGAIEVNDDIVTIDIDLANAES